MSIRHYSFCICILHSLHFLLIKEQKQPKQVQICQLFYPIISGWRNFDYLFTFLSGSFDLDLTFGNLKQVFIALA